jgi:hypothetical protein
LNSLVSRLGKSDCSLGHAQTPVTCNGLGRGVPGQESSQNGGRIPTGMQTPRNASRQNHNWSNEMPPQKTNHTSQPYVPLPGFWLSEGRLRRWWMLRTVAICCRSSIDDRNCCRRLQTVAACYQTQESEPLRRESETCDFT